MWPTDGSSLIGAAGARCVRGMRFAGRLPRISDRYEYRFERDEQDLFISSVFCYL